MPREKQRTPELRDRVLHAAVAMLADEGFAGFRAFVRANPVLAHVMFGRPFADFDPGERDAAAQASLNSQFVRCVRRCVDAGVIAGDPIDIAHILLAFAQGLLAQETAGWLGSTEESKDRRWTLAFDAVLAGLRPVPVS